MSRALVVVENTGGNVRRACLEALGRARSLGLTAEALVTGTDPLAAAAAVAPYADLVLCAAHELFAHGDADVLVPLVAGVVTERSPVLILVPATLTGRDLAARLAARLGAPYAAEVTDISLDPSGRPRAVRPVLGGKALATVGFAGDGPCLVTVRANALGMPAPGQPGEIRSTDPRVDPGAVRTRVTPLDEAGAGRVPLGEAGIVVSGGRGLQDASRFELLEKLADRLGAAVGASRAVVDAGWKDVSFQVGKSGNTVAPRLYVAFGVSGAVHHVMGMDGSGTVVVVNKDPDAPFFKHADHGLVADAVQVLGLLVRRLGG